MTNLRMADDEEEPRHLRWRQAVEEVIHALASSVGGKDLYMTDHQRRVTALACAIAEEMEIPEDRIEGIKLAAMIHDIGRLYTPGEILSKPADLTEIEFDLVKMHPVIGYEILKDLALPWPLAQIIVQHHERLDGSGYPTGLSGDAILLEARIMAVADVIESLLSPRAYRPARGVEDALAEIVSHSGTLYDPDVVQSCLRLFQEKRFDFDLEAQQDHSFSAR